MAQNAYTLRPPLQARNGQTQNGEKTPLDTSKVDLQTKLKNMEIFMNSLGFDDARNKIDFKAWILAVYFL